MLKVNHIVVEHSSKNPMLLPWLRLETDVEIYSSTLYRIEAGAWIGFPADFQRTLS